jgi:hypothetical protein
LAHGIREGADNIALRIDAVGYGLPGDLAGTSTAWHINGNVVELLSKALACQQQQSGKQPKNRRFFHFSFPPLGLGLKCRL